MSFISEHNQTIKTHKTEKQFEHEETKIKTEQTKEQRIDENGFLFEKR